MGNQNVTPILTQKVGSKSTRVSLASATTVLISSSPVLLNGVFANTTPSTTTVSFLNGTTAMKVLPAGKPATGDQILFPSEEYLNGLSLQMSTTTGAGDLTITWVPL